MSRPTPLFIAAIISLLVVGAALYIIAKVYDYEMNQRAEELLQSQRQGWQPRRLDCPGGITWECIINETGEDNDKEIQVRAN